MKEAGKFLDRQYLCRTGDATPMFTDAEFERRFRVPRTTYETIRFLPLFGALISGFDGRWIGCYLSRNEDE
jgi:hypothetical protein